MSQGLRVLVSAYACDPGRGSEPGVGWNWVREIAKRNQAWIITRWNNRPAIERALAQDPLPNAHFVYFDLPKWMRWWKKGSRGLRCYYYLWQVAGSFKAAGLHAKVHFEIAHHVTFVTYWLPSLLAFLPIPFVWGPVGGGESTPASFRRAFSARGRLHEYLRDLVQAIGRMDPLTRWTARRAGLALAATADTAARLRGLGCRRIRVFSSMALPAQEIQALAAMPDARSTPFRVAQVGDLLHLKGCELSLNAFARMSREMPEAEFWFIGGGPDRERLQGLAAKLGIREKVTFWGQLSRAQTLQKLADCHAMVYPAMHDSGGCACTEALAAGRPVICMDLGGPALQVTEESGIKIPAISPEQVVNDLAAAMKELALSPARLAAMRDGARRRVQDSLSWESKGEQIVAMYREVMQAAQPAVVETAGSVARYSE